MARHQIIVNGKSYPFEQKLGAALRFKKETGQEIQTVLQEMNSGIDHMSDFCVWIWCCAVSTCNSEGADFPFDMQLFLDSIDFDDVAEVMESLAADQKTKAKTKAAPKKAIAL